MAIEPGGKSTAEGQVSGGLKIPFLNYGGAVINLASVSKIQKLDSGGSWYVMFYDSPSGSTLTDGYSVSVADEGTADTEIEIILNYLKRMSASTNFSDLT